MTIPYLPARTFVVLRSVSVSGFGVIHPTYAEGVGFLVNASHWDRRVS